MGFNPFINENNSGGGGGGGGFTPTEEQLTAMNSGIDSEKVTQIATNAQNISGKQDTIDSSHKLSSDLVDDTNHTNKFVTAAEKEKINNALIEEVYNAGKQYSTSHGEIFNDYVNNKASGLYSHAEGCAANASGMYSHAEGYDTKTTGQYSHAEGAVTTANGSYSHVEGLETIASGNTQHVQGKYNIEDSNGKYAFIIGNGTQRNQRSNAFAIDWDGKIYVGNSATGVDISNLDTRLAAVETTIGNINSILEEVL